MENTLTEVLDPSNIVYEDFAFNTYMVADGVKYPMLYSDLEDGVLEYDILFREDKLREKLHKVAPFLVKLDYTCEVAKSESEALLKQCYGKNGAVFFAAPLEFDDALERMRDIFYLYDEEGKESGVLRFYEPLVLDALMHTAGEEARKSLFLYIYCYWCEDSEESLLMQYRYTSEGIDSKKIDIVVESPA